MSAPFTLNLDPVQVKAILKQTISANPELLKEVLRELRESPSREQRFEQVVDDIFVEYDDVFRALA